MHNEEIVEFSQYFRKYRNVLDKVTGELKPEYVLSEGMLGAFCVQVHTGMKRYRIGFSLASAGDKFDRTKGMQLARSRMLSSSWVDGDSMETFGVTQEVLDNIPNTQERKKKTALAYMMRDAKGIRPVYTEVGDEPGSPPTLGLVMPHSMRNFYMDIIVPRMERILNPRDKSMSILDIQPGDDGTTDDTLYTSQ